MRPTWFLTVMVSMHLVVVLLLFVKSKENSFLIHSTILLLEGKLIILCTMQLILIMPILVLVMVKTKVQVKRHAVVISRLDRHLKPTTVLEHAVVEVSTMLLLKNVALMDHLSYSVKKCSINLKNNCF